MNFYLDAKKSDKNGDTPIRVSIAIRGVRYMTTTGMKVPPGKWDGDRQQVRRGATNGSGFSWNVINSYLNRISAHFASYEVKCMSEGFSLNRSEIKVEFGRVFGRGGSASGENDVEIGFWGIYERFVAERSLTNNWTVATHQKFSALRGHLQGWSGERELGFGDFTESGLGSFVAYLRDVKCMKNSTIGKQLGFLRWFLRWATLNGYNENTAFQRFTPKLKTAPKQVVFLEWDELMRVMAYEVPEDGTVVTLHDADGREYEKVVHASRGLRITRDIFCFCCFTSLRFSDANNLKRSNISGGALTITTIKTADTITIELNKYARAILERWENEDLGGYALPRITNQRMNMYLKDLCELCEINRLITHTYYSGVRRVDETMPKYELVGTHTGRRTFICNALMLGIPAQIVMKWTGHSDYKSMKPYVDVASSAKAKAMSKFDEL